MQPNIEVIDVEEFYEHLQRKSLDDLRRKYKKLKEENRRLDTKISHLHRANDALNHTLFEQDQRRNGLARRLGFNSVESAEAFITSEDPWVSGGKAALSEAHARLLQLEDEVAKHVTAGEEAQSVITETKEQLEETHRHLNEALEDIMRLREERDLARQEADRQAIEANKWRNEVQTTLPEIQTLLREQQQRNQALLASRPTASPDKKNMTPGQLQYNPSPLREVANATSPSEGHSSPSPLITTHEAQRYKQQFELLETRYEALLEVKEKISKKFCEQLVRWKRFKHWLVKEETQGGRKMCVRRRFSRRRKVMEETGPQTVPQDARHSDSVTLTAQDEAVLTKPLNDGFMHDDHGTTGQPRHHSTPTSPWSPVKSDPKDALAPRSIAHRVEESSTQPSSVPASPHPAISPHIPDTRSLNLPKFPYEFGSTIPLSQQSLTQASSVASPSPLPASKDAPHAITKEFAQPRVFAIDSPPSEMVAVKREELVIKNEETSQLNVALRRSASLTFAPDTPVRTRTPQITATHLLRRQKLKNVQPISEPPPAKRLRHPSSANGQDIRRTNSVLVIDTPHRTNRNTLTRHHSPPPDSPHLHRREKRKRTMEETDDESDPFKAGSSRVRATAFQTRDEKLARLKDLHKKPSKGYMAEYMRFKGRGRYSNANTAPDKTVNGKFEIDPDKNDGLDFQYDGVVRGKDERRRLEASDCECCRAYYEAIGPLPPRLQAPLWKSPSSDINQHTTRPCRYENNGLRNKMPMSSPSARVHTKAVKDHKQSISRHRHNWAPPNTPPDFWKIEFPDTPTVKDINRRADEMHAHKFERIEAEANNGRYRKRT